MFFTVSLSKDEKKLSYHMNPFLRGALWFFLVSVLLMFVFSYTEADFNNASIFGKINTIVLPVLLLAGSLYKYTIVFNKDTEEIEIHKGLLFYYKTKKYNFDELNQIVKRHIKISRNSQGGMEGKLTSYRRDRFIFGFVINGILFLIDRNGKPVKIEQFYMSFKTFFPYSVTEENS